jgi:SprT protein
MGKHLAEMQIDTREAVAFFIDLATEIYDKDFEMPSVQFDLRGCTAGMAYCQSWRLRFNNVLLSENYEDMLENTVPHEVAHLVARAISPYRIKPHGNEWKAVMRAFGRKPERCHSYDVENARVRRRSRRERVQMRCGGCGQSISVGPIQYKKMMTGRANYRTKCCRAELEKI